MDFAFSESQEMLREELSSWLAAALGDRTAWLAGNGGSDLALWQQLGSTGWLGVAAPVAYGGQGGSVEELAVVAEELGRAVAPVPFLSTILMVAEALLCYGSEAQKQKYLPDLFAGRTVAALASFEQGRLAQDQVAVEFADGKLRGCKRPVLDGDSAQLALVLAREGDGHSLALVELDQVAVNCQPLQSFDLLHGQAELTFQSASAERLGGAGEGWELFRG